MIFKRKDNININILMSESYKDIYIQLKSIFEGCDTIIDAMYFGNIYIEKYPHMKNMILSYMNGKKYKDNIDMISKQNMLNDVNLCETRDEALEAISKLTNKTTDDVYRKTLDRIAHKKTYRKNKSVPLQEISHNLTKKCPHCNHAVNMPEATQYIICGYHNPSIGYDWNGCGRDWCFHCNKMLCKKWEVDNLYLLSNRDHDEECCSKHAKETGHKYPDDYCQCNNMNFINSFIK